jgi:uncharacterized repeat protein (TIGR01451 family)
VNASAWRRFSGSEHSLDIRKDSYQMVEKFDRASPAFWAILLDAVTVPKDLVWYKLKADQLQDSQALDEVVVSPPATSADLAISETASDRRVERGELLVYLIKVTNKGPDTAVSLNVTDTLPAGTAFLRAYTNKGACTGPAVGSAGTLSCSLNSLNVGNAAWLIQVAVRVTAKGGSTLINTASVVSSTPDPNLLNNSATVITKVVVEVEEEEDDWNFSLE